MKYIVLEFSFMEAPDYTVFLERDHYLVSASKLLKDQNYYGTRG